MILKEKIGGLDKKKERCRKKFLRNFPGGFHSEKYVAWERDYKWNAHQQWKQLLNEKEYFCLLEEGQYNEIANRAVKIETRTNLLFSFEKMALRDGVRSEESARRFAEGLYKYIYSDLDMHDGFEIFKAALASLPKIQTRVLTWPVLTVFPFIAKPDKHIYLKPRVTQTAAEKYGFPFEYSSKPNWNTYESMLAFAYEVWHDIEDLEPRDMIDIQSFIWVQGSDEY